MNVQQALTLLAVIVLAILAGAGVYYWGVVGEAELGKTLIMLCIPTIAAIACNAAAQGRERVVIEQPAGFRGVVVYIAAEEKEAVAKILEKLQK